MALNIISDQTIVDDEIISSHLYYLSIEDLCEIISPNSILQSSIFNLIGYKYYQLNNLSESLTFFQRSLSLNPANKYTLYNIASFYNFNLRNPENALVCINDALKFAFNDSRFYNLKGLILLNINSSKSIEDSITNFLKAIEINERFFDPINNVGNAYLKIGDKTNARLYFNKAARFKSKYRVNAFLELAKIFDEEGNLFKALNLYNKAIHFDSTTSTLPRDIKKSNMFNWRGTCYAKIGNLSNAKNDFIISLKLDVENEDAKINLGLLSIIYGDYSIAIDYLAFLEQSVNPNHTSKLILLGLSYLMTNNISKSIDIFRTTRRSGYNDINYVKFLWNQVKSRLNHVSLLLFLSIDNLNFEIYSFLGDRSSDLIDLQYDYQVETFFNYVMNEYSIEKDKSMDYSKYKTIYLKSMEIINSLKVGNIYEETVSHYTKSSSLKSMVLDNSPIRISVIDDANDVEEGKVLNYFLGLSNYDKEVQNLNPLNDDFNAHIGCFTFNHNSLNQFRLYGNDEHKKINGACLVLKKSLFSDFTQVNNFWGANNVIDSNRNTINEKLTLYRCIYIDPYTNKLISIGHREEFTFYRSEKLSNDQIKKNAIHKYQRYVSKQKQTILKLLLELHELVTISKLDSEIISKILVQLRYLVKHSAFKEEQECRIIYITNKKEITNKTFNYLTLRDHIKSIYYAPHFDSSDSFSRALIDIGLNYDCKQSNHPIKMTT